MKISVITSVVLLFSFFQISAQENQYPNVNLPLSVAKSIPKEWILAGSNPRDYELTQENTDPYSGYFSCSIQSIVTRPQGYVTLMQTIKSDKYKDERISFSGYVKAKFVSDWAALWMRVDDVLGRPLSFDNMNDRPIVGNSDWVKYEIVLDVPNNSSEISFGVLLDGRGQIMFDNFELKIVGNDVPVTDKLKNKFEKSEPFNLDFEH